MTVLQLLAMRDPENSVVGWSGLWVRALFIKVLPHDWEINAGLFIYFGFLKQKFQDDSEIDM